MSKQMSDEELYEEARRRVEAKRGFYIHLSLYILINLLLVIIWWATGAGYPWFVFPLGGWGIGIVFHFLDVFVFSRKTDWERKAIDKEMEKLRKGRG